MPTLPSFCMCSLGKLFVKNPRSKLSLFPRVLSAPPASPRLEKSPSDKPLRSVDNVAPASVSSKILPFNDKPVFNSFNASVSASAAIAAEFKSIDAKLV